MRFYGLTDLEILAMPAYRFFTINGHIDVLRAEEEMTRITYDAATQSDESAKKVTFEYEQMRRRVVGTEIEGEKDGRLWKDGMNKIFNRK